LFFIDALSSVPVALLTEDARPNVIVIDSDVPDAEVYGILMLIFLMSAGLIV
jgi:hypothetical protein